MDGLDIQIRATHIPGKVNTVTDSLSRLERSGDYSIKKDILFKAVNQMKIHVNVDLFASTKNHRLLTFCSLRCPPQPTKESNTKLIKKGGNPLGNAFHIHWGGGMVPLMHPPIPLIGRTLRKFAEEGKTGILIAPDWKGQVWSPLLNKLKRRKILLGESSEILVPGPGMKRRDQQLPPGKLAMYLLRSSPRFKAVLSSS
jgi:hypothetical protein